MTSSNILFLQSGFSGRSFLYFLVTIQNSGRTGRKIRIKLVCKRVFLPVLTSEESPMLLVRLYRTRRCPVLNSYISSISKTLPDLGPQLLLYTILLYFNKPF